MSTRPPLILASASPRRADLLRAAGIPFETAPADIDESVLAGESPAHYVLRLAREKAQAAAATVPGRIVLAADTTVVVDGEILGKPEDAADARRMLELISGRVHEVLTGVALLVPSEASDGEPTCEVEIARSHVRVAELTPVEVDWYIASGEPFGKAGAYAVQGRASRFITHLDGSHSNVVGLPIAVVHAMLARAGVASLAG